MINVDLYNFGICILVVVAVFLIICLILGVKLHKPKVSNFNYRIHWDVGNETINFIESVETFLLLNTPNDPFSDKEWNRLIEAIATVKTKNLELIKVIAKVKNKRNNELLNDKVKEWEGTLAKLQKCIYDYNKGLYHEWRRKILRYDLLKWIPEIKEAQNNKKHKIKIIQ